MMPSAFLTADKACLKSRLRGAIRPKPSMSGTSACMNARWGAGSPGDDTPEFFVDEGTVVLVAAALQAQQFHRIEYGHHIYLTGIAAVGGLYPVLFHKFAD